MTVNRPFLFEPRQSDRDPIPDRYLNSAAGAA